MRTSPIIPEITKGEEIRQRYSGELHKICSNSENELMLDMAQFAIIMDLMDDYSQAKIDLIFEEESHRNEGKVRGEKGVGFIKR
jgi:hypothetical protein